MTDLSRTAALVLWSAQPGVCCGQGKGLDVRGMPYVGRRYSRHVTCAGKVVPCRPSAAMSALRPASRPVAIVSVRPSVCPSWSD